MRIAIVGCTGLVGVEVLKVIKELKLKVSEIIPIASEKSAGKDIVFNEKTYKIVGIQQGLAQKPDIAIFSAGGNISKQWAPEFAKTGCYVVDNSSAWRMDPNIKLIVPEINGNLLTPNDKIIANPNCSTIQLVMVLAPLHRKFVAKRVVVSTYQAVTGTGQKAVDQLYKERAGDNHEKVYPHAIDLNCLPHCDSFTENGYTKEELKLVNEIPKILGEKKMNITATAVRIPVVSGHSESINIEFKIPFKTKEVRDILEVTKGVVVVDNPARNEYPMPVNAKNKNEVFVGRIRRDYSLENGINLWVVADNLRKGAATNAVQIVKLLVEKKIISS
ncbi:MAG TPA: aspartate-semialdehyde dehydrogenase [Bacteroidales bacterium]|nr:aspartate-semialdehyde dehydrogenase [Bacteroidales bacterium]